MVIGVPDITVVLVILAVTDALLLNLIWSPVIKPPVDTVITTLELLILDVITAVPILVLLLINAKLIVGILLKNALIA